ncbi:MAG: HDIG domain-containing protein [Caldilineaceae bacterium]|nr:HDIG domain-containing protein [Caldilineaceae bacterium]
MPSFEAQFVNWKPKHPAFQSLIWAFLDELSPVYIVGGAVRDHLLQQDKELADLDLVIGQPALATAQRVADRIGWAYYPMDEARDIARLVFTLSGDEPLVCDVARMQGQGIEQDLLARDFTINAMAIAVDREQPPRLIDICGGQADLEEGLLRRVSVMSLAEDAVRLIRAVRMSSQFGFRLEEETRAQVKRLSGTVRLASTERIRDELWKLSTTSAPDQAIEEMRILSLLAHVLPEVAATIGIEQSPPHYLDVYSHTLKTVRYATFLRKWIVSGEVSERGEAADELVKALSPWRHKLRGHFLRTIAAARSRADWLIWHALLHDIGKPSTRTREEQPDGAMRYRFLGHDELGAQMTERILGELRFSRQEISLSTAVVRSHMRPHMLHASFGDQPISRRACYRFFRDVGNRQHGQPAAVDTLMLALADVLATYRERPDDWGNYLRHANQLLAFAFDDTGLKTAQRQPLVDGHRLMQELELAPGRQLGEMLERLKEAQVAGEIATTDEALALASDWLESGYGSS